nr:Down syndrome cell adhesion molecule-like protein Dscam2 isoform X1 [Lepeophtheirus salmonis]
MDFLSVRVEGESTIEFNTALLRCKVLSSSSAVITEVMSWHRGGLQLYPSERGDGKYHVLPNGDLLIMQAEYPEDTLAPFSCRIKNIMTGAEQISPPFDLQVQEKGTLSRPEKRKFQNIFFNYAKGSTAILFCNIQSHPPPAFSWFRVKNNLLEPISRSNRIHLSAGTLIIDDVQLNEDEGQYRCTARNERGEENLSMTLSVETNIAIDVVPSEQIIDIGRKARLECLTESRDRDSIHWKKDGRDLPSHNRILTNKQTLQIFNLQREDYGMYQCFVRRDTYEAQASSELRLGDASPVLTYRFIDQTLQPGPLVSLKCTSRGSPTPGITWSLNGFPLPDNERFMMGQYVTVHGDVISHVNISDVQVQDGGQYMCLVANRAGSVSHSARLNVYGRPHVQSIPEMRAIVGKMFRVICPASGYPLEKIVWTKDGQKLPFDRRHLVFDNGTLIISKVIRKDTGRYFCTASNRQGTSASQSGDLKVLVPPTINHFSVGEHLRLGQRVSMLCSITDGDLPISLTWYRNSEPLSDGGDGISLTQIGDYESVLRIDDLKPQHNANFTCVAKNSAGITQYSQYLRVKVPPEWVTKPHDLEAVEGQDVFFHCRVSGVPEPMIVWRKLANEANVRTNGNRRRIPLLELSSQRPVYRNYKLLINGTLYIRKVTDTDEGSFLCEAENGVNEPLGQVVHLKINAPPKFENSHVGVITGRMEEAIELQCVASGDDHISMTWRKDGRDYLTTPGKSRTTEIRELDKVTSKLRIENANINDAGKYSCLASNAFGKSNYAMDVTVWEPPPTPSNVTIMDILSRSVKVSWIGVERSTPAIERIVIQWKEQSENWYPEGKQNILPGVMSETTVQGLRPWTVYHLRVFAENQLGKSKEGKVLQFVTNGEKPGGPPRNLRITGLTSTSLEVTWDDPDPKLIHGPIVRYNLGYMEYSSQNYRFVDVDKFDSTATSSKFIINRLKKYTRYEIVIQGINIYGEGPLSRPSIGQTQEDAPDGPPEKVHCVSLTPTKIQVSWHPPHENVKNGIIKGYKVLYAPHPGRIPSNNLPLPKLLRLSSVSTLLENLKKYSNYTLQVLAFTSAGDGKYSKVISCTTHTDVPGPPERIHAVVQSPESIIISWLPPTSPNGRIERYHIYLRALSHGRDRTHTKYTRPADVRWITIEDLESERQYQFWVTAVTSEGEGMSSNVITQTVTSRVPAKISSISQTVYGLWRKDISLNCRYVGNPTPDKKWLFNDREYSWLQYTNMYGESNLHIKTLSEQHNGNFTCLVENRYGSDTINYNLKVQVPPKPPIVEVSHTASDTITVRWKVVNDGNSPITKTLLNYKVTYGEWKDEELAWHQRDHILKGLHCGREYHIYMIQYNILGPSPASDVLTVHTQGSRPTGPPMDNFIVSNVTYFTLRLDQWEDHNCAILYFVLEYKLESSETWITVANDLQLQSRYNIRGLKPDTKYNLKVTAHSHAGSTSVRYSSKTLPENYSGAAPFGNIDDNRLSRAIMGLGLRSILLIIISSLCFILASLGVCVCLRKKHPPHSGPMGYGEIPKTCGMESNRQDHQLYATIQRKAAPMTPFSGGGVPISTTTSSSTTGSNSSKSKRDSSITPESGVDIFPYASSTNNNNNNLKNNQYHRFHTLGRMRTLEMAEYQKQKLIHEANAVKIKESKEYTLSLNRRNQRFRRRAYSESEEYDTDTSGDREFNFPPIRSSINANSSNINILNHAKVNNRNDDLPRYR